MIRSKNGYSFQFQESACMQCKGRCCTGESGFIWVDFEEIEAIAEHLKIEFSRMVRQYVRREEGRFSLKEIQRKQGDYACIFFQEGCQIYEVRPKQCRSYPFWPRFKQYPSEVKAECPGILCSKE